MRSFKNIINSAIVVAACSASGHANAGGVDGYWSGGYLDGVGGQIQLELTIINGFGELTYNASNWGELGFAICSYVFAVEADQPLQLTRNSAAGTGDCVEQPSASLSRTLPDLLVLSLGNPEFALETAELSGFLRPLDPAEAHGPIPGFDIVGVSPGMTFDEIEQLLLEKDFVFQESNSQAIAYEGFTIEQKAWGRGADQNGSPTDWIFATFTAKKDWMPEELPIATNVGREWLIPESEAISGATMVDTLAKKYGQSSNDINEDRLFDRSGQLLSGAFNCPESVHQPIISNYALRSEVGQEEVQVSCGGVVRAFVGTDMSTGRANLLKLRLTDPDPVWQDFWSTWSHTEGARIKGVFDGVTGATGSSPEL
jgi:hypothetical protein